MCQLILTKSVLDYQLSDILDYDEDSKEEYAYPSTRL